MAASLGLIPGDVIRVEGTVTMTFDPYVEFRIDGGYERFTVQLEQVALVRHAIRVGDRVAPAVFRTGPVGEVKAVIGDRAWIEWPAGPSIEPTDKLVRLPSPDSGETDETEAAPPAASGLGSDADG